MPSLTPKAMFLLDKEAVQRHLDLVVSAHTLRSLEIALVQLLLELTAADQLQAAAHHYRLEGARHLIRIWLNLAETPQEKPTITDSRLTY